tara:strand:- start:29893 stop:31140 length:1248 start_codon:yes stop_codon:yes gene_type:complete
MTEVQSPPSTLRKVEFDPEFRGPLSDIVVTDLSRLVAGNMLSLQLADFGAEVFKVEAPGRGDPLRAWRENGHSIYWKAYGRNKRSIAIDLKSDAGKALVRDLARSSNILIENYRPGRMEEMGLGPDILFAENPNLIIVRVSGFGQTGPYRNKPGFGSLIEAMSGFATRNGFDDREPVLPPLALADMIAGMQGAYSVMVALREVELGHRAGQIVDLSLLEPMFSVLGPEPGVYAVTGNRKTRSGSGSNTSSPRNVYKTSDGHWLALSASIQTMAERLFRTIGRDDLNHDPAFATNSERIKRRAEVDEIVGGWIGERTRDEALGIFDAAGVTVGPVYDVDDILTDTHFAEREIAVQVPDEDVGHVTIHGISPKLSESPGGLRCPAPTLGQDTRYILQKIGKSDDEIADLLERSVAAE